MKSSAPLMSGIPALIGSATNAGFEWRQSLPYGVLTAGIGVRGRGPLMPLRLAITLLGMLIPVLWSAHAGRQARRRALQGSA